ncbi:MAG: slipin family protein [Candidatus Aenigmarchaeota archaeon]|nr:slipin family protein [Candidatus Aenigmarchaeota archaeon]
MTFEFVLGIVVLILIVSIKQIYEYERGILFTMGRYSHMLSPGWRIVLPVFQSMQKVDLRVKTVDVPSQETMTKDNVSARVNAVLYYKITDASKSILSVEDYMYAMSQLAQTTMRNVIGEVSLDELLSKRDKVSQRIMQIVDRESDPWGIKVTSVDLKDVELPGEMKRVMAKGAEADRERRAVIIKAEGEVVASNNLAKAAKTLAASDGALHLRTLQSINDLSSDQSNTVIFAIPLEVLRAVERTGKKK